MNSKKLIKYLSAIILILILSYFTTFYLAPYLEARLLIYRMNKLDQATKSALSLIDKSIPSTDSMKEVSRRIGNITEEIKKVLEPYTAHFQEHGFLKFLENTHRPPEYSKTTYCFYSPPSPPSLEEVQNWLKPLNAEQLLENIKDYSWKYKPNYERKFHKGGEFYAYADYLKTKSPGLLHPKIFYREKLYRYIDKIQNSKQVLEPTNTETEQFLEDNSRFLTSVPLVLDLIIPQVKHKIFEQDTEEILQSFEQMISSLGACEHGYDMNLQDLVARNECYRHVERWQGPYVSSNMLTKLEKSQFLGSVEIKEEKLPESMKYSIEISEQGEDGYLKSNKKTKDVLVNFNDVFSAQSQPLPPETLKSISQNKNPFDNIDELFTSARIVPNFKDGKPFGLKFGAVKIGSVWEKIGFKAGDIWASINGQTVSLHSLGLLKSKKLEFGVMREGKVLTLRYSGKP